jgi:hypothetical protein
MNETQLPKRSTSPEDLFFVLSIPHGSMITTYLHPGSSKYGGPFFLPPFAMSERAESDQLLLRFKCKWGFMGIGQLSEEIECYCMVLVLGWDSVIADSADGDRRVESKSWLLKA